MIIIIIFPLFLLLSNIRRLLILSRRLLLLHILLLFLLILHFSSSSFLLLLFLLLLRLLLLLLLLHIRYHHNLLFLLPRHDPASGMLDIRISRPLCHVYCYCFRSQPVPSRVCMHIPVKYSIFPLGSFLIIICAFDIFISTVWPISLFHRCLTSIPLQYCMMRLPLRHFTCIPIQSHSHNYSTYPTLAYSHSVVASVFASHVMTGLIMAGLINPLRQRGVCYTWHVPKTSWGHYWTPIRGTPPTPSE